MPDIWDPDTTAIEVDELVTASTEATFRWLAGRAPLLDTPLQRQMFVDIVHADSQLLLARMRDRVRRV